MHGREARRRQWRSGGTGSRRWSVSGHGMAKGGARETHRHSAVLVHAMERREEKRRGGVHGAELTSELGRALVSNSQGREAYHGEVARTQGARGEGEASGEMEWSPASCGGRTSQIRRGSWWRPVAGAYAGAVRARGEGRSRKCDARRALWELKPWPAVPGLPQRVDAESGRRRRVAPRGGQALTRLGAWRGDGRGAREKDPAHGVRPGRLCGWAESEAAAR